METQHFTHYSSALGRYMDCKIYGHAGRPVLRLLDICNQIISIFYTARKTD